MTDVWQDIGRVFLFSFSSVLYLFFISKLLGKKQIAQLDFIDYTMGISIGSIASEFATDISDKPYYFYLIAMAVFALFHLLITFLERKGPLLKQLLNGKPLTLIYDGKIDYKQLKKSQLDVNDVIALARQKDCWDISKIAFAILENSGQLTILLKGEEKMLTVADAGVPPTPAALPYYMVVDGNISYSSLRELNRDAAWLHERLNAKTPNELKNIILAVYDKEADEFLVNNKKN